MRGVNCLWHDRGRTPIWMTNPCLLLFFLGGEISME